MMFRSGHKKGGQHSDRLLASNNARLLLRDLEFAGKHFTPGRTDPCFQVVLLLTRLSEGQGRTCDSSDLATFFIFYCPTAVSRGICSLSFLFLAWRAVPRVSFPGPSLQILEMFLHPFPGGPAAVPSGLWSVFALRCAR